MLSNHKLFGQNVLQYAATRASYPMEVLDSFWERVQINNPIILDIGCGTGISSRLLSKNKHSLIIACDTDSRMISVAKKHSNIVYLRADAEKLPFSDETFDATTAFGSFHWFNNSAALSELKRVLKPNGVVLIVNKNDISDFSNVLRSIILDVCGEQVSDVKKDYDPQKSLLSSGFINIRTESLDMVENYDVSSLLSRYQSMSYWSTIPAKHIPEVRKRLLSHFEYRTANKIERPLRIESIIARTPKP